MKYPKNRRKLRSKFINPEIQLRLLSTNLTYIILIIGVIILALLAPFYSDISRSSELYTQHLSASIFIILIERLFVALFVILVLSFLHQIIISHRFCGPLVNFNKTFKKISQGDLTRKLSLRPHDFLKNEAAQVNEMIDGLSGLITTLREDHDRLFETIEKMQGNNGQQANFDASFKTLKHQAQVCAEHLSKIKIEMEPVTDRE